MSAADSSAKNPAAKPVASSTTTVSVTSSPISLPMTSSTLSSDALTRPIFITQPPSLLPDPDILREVEIETRDRNPGSELMTYPRRRPTIPGLFPRRTVNLLIGATASGKTALVLTQLESYLASGQFLGYQLAPEHEPDQCGAVVCSGTLESLYDRILALELDILSDLSRFPIRAWDPQTSETGVADTLTRLYDELTVAARRPIRFLLIEGLQLMMDGKAVDPKATKDFYNILHKFCMDNDVTILGTVGMPKMKRGESYPILGDRAYGCAVWTAEASTLIGIEACHIELPEEARPTYRRVLLQTRASTSMEILYLSMQEGQGASGGAVMTVLSYEPDRGRVEPSSEVVLDRLLEQYSVGTEMTKETFRGWGETHGISDRTIERWLQARIMLGSIRAMGTTRNRRYVKPLPN